MSSDFLFGGPGKRLLLVASTGGHLSQLVRFAEREQVHEDSVWVSFESPQSQTLLKGKKVLWVDYVAPRDFGATARAFSKIRRSLKHETFDGALSTGAAVGLAGIYWAKLKSIPTAYIESVSRTDGPSLTGKLVDRFNLARTYTQHRTWSNHRWTPIAPVLSQFTQTPKVRTSGSNDPLKILVTLGTIKPYRFDRLIDQLMNIVQPQDEVIWQLGTTSRNDLPGTTYGLLDNEAFLEIAQASDVVITHAGVGTILQLMDHGISPVVVPRRKEHHEHVDDHQLQIWNLLQSTGLGHTVGAEQLTRDLLVNAASTRIESVHP